MPPRSLAELKKNRQDLIVCTFKISTETLIFQLKNCRSAKNYVGTDAHALISYEGSKKPSTGMTSIFQFKNGSKGKPTIENRKR